MTLDWSMLIEDGYDTEYEMFYDLRIVKKLSLLDLEERLGVSHNTIGRRCKALGITRENYRDTRGKKEESRSLPVEARVDKSC